MLSKQKPEERMSFCHISGLVLILDAIISCKPSDREHHRAVFECLNVFCCESEPGLLGLNFSDLLTVKMAERPEDLNLPTSIVTKIIKVPAQLKLQGTRKALCPRLSKNYHAMSRLLHNKIVQNAPHHHLYPRIACRLNVRFQKRQMLPLPR